MTDILIQFHAVIDELVTFVREAVAEVPVHLTAFRSPPFVASAIEADEIEPTLCDDSVSGIAFTLGPAKPAHKGAMEFLDHNPGALRLNIGRMKKGELLESSLSARTTDERALEAWQKLARKLKKLTRAGAIAINPVTGATATVKNHRYTAGAKALDDAGVTIRPLGGSVLHFGEKGNH